MLAPLETALLVLTVIATAVMAASAAVQAVRAEFDAVGTIFLSVVSAVGGGTLRDLMLGATPVFWLNDPVYLMVAVPTGLLSHFLAAQMQVGTGKRLKLLAYLDAIGLALFTLVGVQVALSHGQGSAFAVILGCLTGIGGGLFRDVLCGITPIVLRKDVYATLSLAGGALYLLLGRVWGDTASFLVAFAAITIARVIVVARAP